MKRMGIALAALTVALLPAVASAQKVSTDFDPKVSFATYKTFAWTTGDAAPNPLNETRIHDGVEAKLSAAGLKPATANPDLIVSTHASGQEKKELYSTGYGGPYRWGGGMGTTTVQTYVVGMLVVDLYDAKTKQLVWRGTATDTMSDKPEKNVEKINKSIEKMFKAYPPKAK